MPDSRYQAAKVILEENVGAATVKLDREDVAALDNTLRDVQGPLLRQRKIRLDCEPVTRYEGISDEYLQ